jgi:hypothetical protein
MRRAIWSDKPNQSVCDDFKVAGAANGPPILVCRPTRGITSVCPTLRGPLAAPSLWVASIRDRRGASL